MPKTTFLQLSETSERFTAFIVGVICEAFEEDSTTISSTATMSSLFSETEELYYQGPEKGKYSPGAVHPDDSHNLAPLAHKQETYLRLLIHRTNAVVFCINLNNEIDFWDVKMAALTGFSSDEAIGVAVTHLFPEKQYADDLLRYLKDALLDQEHAHKRIVYGTADCEHLLLVNTSPRVDSCGEVVGAMCVAWNVTSLSQNDLDNLMQAEALCTGALRLNPR